MTSDPRWLQLIRRHTSDQGLGLTLPFLLGGLRVLAGKAPTEPGTQDDLRFLLTTMRDEAPITPKVRIYRCAGLRTPTAGFAEERLSLGHRVVLPEGKLSNLYAWDEFFESDEYDVQSLVPRLWEELGAVIRSGHFSYLHGAYRTFSQNDLAFILRSRSTERGD